MFIFLDFSLNKNYFSGRREVERHFVKLGCTAQCTKLPPSFPIIPLQCTKFCFETVSGKKCPLSVKQTTIVCCLFDGRRAFLPETVSKQNFVHCSGIVGNEGGSFVHCAVHPSFFTEEKSKKQLWRKKWGSQKN